MWLVTFKRSWRSYRVRYLRNSWDQTPLVKSADNFNASSLGLTFVYCIPGTLRISHMKWQSGVLTKIITQILISSFKEWRNGDTKRLSTLPTFIQWGVQKRERKSSLPDYTVHIASAIHLATFGNINIYLNQ